MQILATSIFAGLVGLVAANPTHFFNHRSKAFTLVVKPEDSGNKLVAVGETVTSLHIGAGKAIAVVSNKNPRIWYLNGTKDYIKDDRFGTYGYSILTYSILTDGGSPPFPSGFSHEPSENQLSNVCVNAGNGTEFKNLAVSDQPTSSGTVLTFNSYAVCEEALPYYRGKSFKVLKNINPTFDEHGKITKDRIPEGCAKVHLLPQCAELPELPKNAIASHEHAVTVVCGKVVKSRD